MTASRVHGEAGRTAVATVNPPMPDRLARALDCAQVNRALPLFAATPGRA